MLFRSDNPLFLSGLTTQEVMAAGGTFNTQYVSEGENIMIVKIIKAWFRFLENIPTEEKLLYSIRYDYMLDKTLVNNVMTVAFLSEEGKPWLVTCTSKVSTNSGSGNVRIMKNNSSTIWNYSIINDKWTQDSMVVLTDIERAVLRLSIQGKREKEICDEIYRSIDGLKSIKKKIFYKMEVNNITEAVSFAITFGLI